MEVGLIIAIGFAVAFALTNGFHDASNAIATLVATRGATPGQAVVLSATFNMAGAFLLGTAVADTIGAIVTVPDSQMVAVVGAGLAGATAWNLITWWLGLPSSSGHALVGGLVGAAVADGILTGAGGLGSVNWTAVIAVLIALFVSPPLGFLGAFLLLRFLRWRSQRWTRRWDDPMRGGNWVTAATLSFSHGGNDAQKAMGVIAVLLLATGETSELTVPLWAKVVTGAALTLGTALGGWRIVRTMGLRITKLTPMQGFCAETGGAATLFMATFLGVPVSTTHTITGAIVGVGSARRMSAVRWNVASSIVYAWVITIPASALVAAAAYYAVQLVR